MRISVPFLVNERRVFPLRVVPVGGWRRIPNKFDALRHDLALIDLGATSASRAQYETLRISAQNQDYGFVDDFFTRLFPSMK